MAPPLPHPSEAAAPPRRGGGFRAAGPSLIASERGEGFAASRVRPCDGTSSAGATGSFQCRRVWKFYPAGLPGIRQHFPSPIVTEKGRPGTPGPEERAYRAHQSSGEEKISHSPARSLNEPPPRWGDAPVCGSGGRGVRDPSLPSPPQRGDHHRGDVTIPTPPHCPPLPPGEVGSETDPQRREEPPEGVRARCPRSSGGGARDLAPRTPVAREGPTEGCQTGRAPFEKPGRAVSGDQPGATRSGPWRAMTLSQPCRRAGSTGL